METEELSIFEGNFKEVPVALSSQEIASMAKMKHDSVLRDCDELNEIYEQLGRPKIEQVTYTDSRDREQREYRLNRMQCFDLITGYCRQFRIEILRRWEELEKKESAQFSSSYADIFRQLAAVVEQNDKQQKKDQQQKCLDEASQ